MSERAPMPGQPVVVAAEVAANAGPNYARRFSLYVAEAELQRMAHDVLPYVVERLARQIAAEHRGDVVHVVHEYLRNREWAEPIIRDAIRETVREHIKGMFAAAVVPPDPPEGARG